MISGINSMTLKPEKRKSLKLQKSELLLTILNLQKNRYTRSIKKWKKPDF